MYCSALAWPRQPVPTSKGLGGMTGREEGEDVTAKRAKLPSNNQSGSRGLQCCGGEGEHTERYIERGSLWAAQRRASAWGNGMSTAV